MKKILINFLILIALVLVIYFSGYFAILLEKGPLFLAKKATIEIVGIGILVDAFLAGLYTIIAMIREIICCSADK
jgi:hypothetical protein